MSIASVMQLGAKTKDMLRELADIVESDPAWPKEAMTTIFFKRRGLADPERVPVVDLQTYVGGESIPPTLWFHLPAWEATTQFHVDKEGAKTWLIQKLLTLAAK